MRIRRDCPPIASPAPQNGQPIEGGQAEIEDHRIVWLGIAEKMRFFAIGRLVDSVTRPFKRRRYLARQAGIVLGEQNSHLLRPLRPCFRA